MKRFAVLFAAVGLWPALPAPAADVPVPTTPQVPKPVPAEVLAVTDGPGCTAGCATGRCGPRLMSRIGGSGITAGGPGGTTVAGHPIPGGPGGGTQDSRSCWEKAKCWVCYRQTPIHLPCKPTAYVYPLYTLFPCTERAGCASGCGPQGCVTAPAARQPACDGATCKRGVVGAACPPASAGGAVPAGFRYAAVEQPKPVVMPAPVPAAFAAPAPQQPVVGASYRAPAPQQRYTVPSLFPGIRTAE